MFVANRDTYKFEKRIKKYIDRGFKRIDYIIFDSDKRLYRDITNIIKKYIPNQISETNSFINEYRIREILSKINNIIYYQKNFNSLKELLTNLDKYNFDYIIKSLQEEPKNSSFQDIIDIFQNPEHYQKYIGKYL